MMFVPGWVQANMSRAICYLKGGKPPFNNRKVVLSITPIVPAESVVVALVEERVCLLLQDQRQVHLEKRPAEPDLLRLPDPPLPRRRTA